MHEVAWTRPARRDLLRLPPRIADVVITYVDERLAARPYVLSKPLQNMLVGLRSARAGDYRILFTVDDEAGRLVVRRVDHRAHVYRR